MTTIEKIKAEILDYFLWDGQSVDNLPFYVRRVLNIIDKYAEQEPCDDVVSRQAVLEIQAKYAEHMGVTRFWKMCDDIKALPSVTPKPIECEDAVSREAAILLASIATFSIDETVEAIKRLPSVRPKSETVTEFADRCRECGAKYGKLLKQEPKTGHWIDNPYNKDFSRCSECGSNWEKSIIENCNMDYCPNCGAKMVEPACDTCRYTTAAFNPCNACKDKSEYDPQESEDKG